VTPGGKVVVVGLGPGDPGSLTSATEQAIARIEHRFVRTRRHPSVDALGEATDFDRLYDEAETLTEVYEGIVAELESAAATWGEVLYAVPGSPLVAERTVELLRRSPRVELDVIPALSFLDLAWARLGVDPLAAGVRLVDGHRFAEEAAGASGPLLVGQADHPMVLSEIKLSVEHGPAVTILQRLGLPDESVVEVPWAELDRSVRPDHLTCLWMPGLSPPVGAETLRLVALMRTLRERCPWDREQTHASLRVHLLEETYEVLDALDGLRDGRPERVEHLCEELGDLLFQVVFHAHLAAEEGWFDLADVTRGVHDKLVARHPHVFANDAAAVPSVADLDAAWEARKRRDKGRASVTDGIPAALPALARTAALLRRAAPLRLEATDPPATPAAARERLARLVAETAGTALDVGPAGSTVDDALGGVLFGVVGLANRLGVDPEAALRSVAGRFRDRVRALEELTAAAGEEPADLPPEARLARWEEAGRRSD
jgi:tetrapyrrole methylase family protein/MazG family protein